MATRQTATTAVLTDDGSKVIEGVIWIHPERVSGAPCFINTRVPIQNLFDYLEGGEPLDEFLEGFLPITREQAVKVLERARTSLFNSILKGEDFLDHNLDWRLSRYLPGHEVNSALQMGWNALKNGALLTEDVIQIITAIQPEQVVGAFHPDMIP